MFFWNKDKSEIEQKLANLEYTILHLQERVIKLETAAHGLKKDLTPRAKPGRKAKVQA